MFHEDVVFIVEATIIIIETIVLLFLIYHIRVLRTRTVLAHEEITAMKEAISDMKTYIKELHEGTTIAHEQITTMKKILTEIKVFIKEFQLKERQKK
jgi:hypothetical protein